MPFQIAGSGSSGFGGQIVGALLQQKFKEMQDQKAMQEIRKAYQTILPSATDQETDALAMAAVRGLPVTGNMLEDIHFRNQMTEYQNTLPADEQKLFANLPTQLKIQQIGNNANYTADLAKMQKGVAALDSLAKEFAADKDNKDPAVQTNRLGRLSSAFAQLGIQSGSPLGESIMNLMFHGTTNPAEKQKSTRLTEEDYQFMGNLSGITSIQDVDFATRLWLSSWGYKTDDQIAALLKVPRPITISARDAMSIAQDYMKNMVVTIAGTAVPGEKDFAGVWNRVMAKLPDGTYKHNNPTDVQARRILEKHFDKNMAMKLSSIMEFAHGWAQSERTLQQMFDDDAAFSWATDAVKRAQNANLTEMPSEWGDQLLGIGYTADQVKSMTEIVNSMINGTFFEQIAPPTSPDK